MVERKFALLLDKVIAKELKARLKTEAEEVSEIGAALGTFENLERRAAEDEDVETENINSVKTKKSAHDNADDDDDDANSSDVEEGDATAEKKLRNRSQKASYDEDDEVDDVDDLGSLDKEYVNDKVDEGLVGVTGDEVDENGNTRLDRLLNSTRYVVGYRFDTSKSRWCELDLKVLDFFFFMCNILTLR